MPIEIDDQSGEVIREWTLTSEEVCAYIAEFEARWPGLLDRLALL
jgi:hypothetical protein